MWTSDVQKGATLGPAGASPPSCVYDEGLGFCASPPLVGGQDEDRNAYPPRPFVRSLAGSRRGRLGRVLRGRPGRCVESRRRSRGGERNLRFVRRIERNFRRGGHPVRLVQRHRERRFVERRHHRNRDQRKQQRHGGGNGRRIVRRDGGHVGHVGGHVGRVRDHRGRVRDDRRGHRSRERERRGDREREQQRRELARRGSRRLRHGSGGGLPRQHSRELP